ncbi:MAG: fumarylacetoacetate hydrolase family protein [Rhodospirillales bacterium]
MRYATFERNGVAAVGLWPAPEAPIQPLDLTAAEAAEGLLAVIDRQLQGRPLRPTGEAVAADSVTLLAPIPRPRRNIFCVGKNYHAHAEEFAASGFDSSAKEGAVPAHPIVFSKLPETVIPDGAPILLDATVSEAVDYEAELAVIIGRAGRAIAKADALAHVWGYTLLNDVTARDLQGRHSQWLIGKGQDSFCPMGPAAISKDDLDLADTTLRCWVNEELRQDANTAQLIFDVPTLIETLSAGITLLPGDVIATGTPAGVGIGFDPPRFLRSGDRVTMEIAPIGRLSNPVMAI